MFYNLKLFVVRCLFTNVCIYVYWKGCLSYALFIIVYMLTLYV